MQDAHDQDQGSTVTSLEWRMLDSNLNRGKSAAKHSLVCFPVKYFNKDEMMKGRYLMQFLTEAENAPRSRKKIKNKIRVSVS